MIQEGKDKAGEPVLRIRAGEIQQTLTNILVKSGFVPEKAQFCARLFTETTIDGVYSHGLNRFPRFIEHVSTRIINPEATPVLVHQNGTFERWDGQSGPGNLNAWFCMARAVELAKSKGSGIVTLRNTNHWMRGGTYGLQAAEEQCIGICFTNTKPNMPPWGGLENKIGNNPLIVAVPNPPEHFLLDMAVSQFSFGKMEIFSQEGSKMPLPAGYDEKGNLTDDPDTVLQTELLLPAGYWKGSGLSIMLDLVVSILSEGLSTAEIGLLDEEHNLSQVFIALHLNSLVKESEKSRIINTVVRSIASSKPIRPGREVYYPGQRTYKRRLENLKKGVPVSKRLWNSIVNM